MLMEQMDPTVSIMFTTEIDFLDFSRLRAQFY